MTERDGPLPDRWPAACRAGIVVALLVAGAGAVRGDYLSTDDWFLLSSGRGSGFASLWERQTAGPPAIRPVSIGMARLQHRLVGDTAPARILGSIVLHGLATLLFAALLIGVGAARRTAWLAAALAAAWPLAAEPLAWYHAGHTSLPVAVLVLGALAAHAHRAALPATLTLLALALLTRENAVMALPVMALISRHRTAGWRPALRDVAPATVLVGGFVLVRGWQIASALLEQSTAWLPLTRPWVAAGIAVFHLLVPVHPGAAGAAIAAIVAAGAMLFLLLRDRRDTLWALVWIAVWCLPFLPVYPTDDPLFSADASFERRWYHLYLPALAFPWLAARAVGPRARWAMAAWAGALTIQAVNIQWWADLGAEARAARVALLPIARGPGPMAFAIEAPCDPLAEVVEHQVLDLDRIYPRPDPPQVYRKIPGDPRLFRSRPDSFGYPHWVEVPRPELVEPAQRVVWRTAARRFESVEVLP